MVMLTYGKVSKKDLETAAILSLSDCGISLEFKQCIPGNRHANLRDTAMDRIFQRIACAVRGKGTHQAVMPVLYHVASPSWLSVAPRR